MSSSNDETDRRSKRSRFSLTTPWGATALVLVGLLLLCAFVNHDDDFRLPNPFRNLSAWVVALFLMTGFIRHVWLRSTLRLCLAVIPILGLVYGELGPQRPHGQHRVVVSDNPLIRYHYKPNFDVYEGQFTNSRGLWDDEYEIPKPDDVLRIVVLGDSVPNDPSVDQDARFHRVLRDRLRDAFGPSIEVINVSCEGFNSIQEVEFFEEVGLEYEPDIVVLAYVINDPALQNAGGGRIGNSRFITRKLYALRLRAGTPACDIMAPIHEGYTFELVVGQSMNRLANLAQLHGFELYAAPLPIVGSADRQSCDPIYDRVIAKAEEHGLTVIDSARAFDGVSTDDVAKPGGRLDFTHPNSLGHRLIGEAIAAHLEPDIRATLAAQAAAEQPEPAPNEPPPEDDARHRGTTSPVAPSDDAPIVP